MRETKGGATEKEPNANGARTAGTGKNVKPFPARNP